MVDVIHEKINLFKEEIMRFEDIFSIVSALVQIIIAIVATMIAVLEYRKAKKENKAEKETIDCLKETVEKVHENTAVDLLNDSKGKQLLFSDDDMKCALFWAAYRNYRRCIKRLYEKFLISENIFSFSYGFPRYIEQFRIFLYNSEKYEQEYKNIRNDKGTCEELSKAGNLIIEGINELNIYIDELCIKYQIKEK